MRIIVIISIIAIACVALSISIVGIIKIRKNNEPEKEFETRFAGIALFCCIAVALLAYGKWSEQKELKNAAENGYTFYVDGVEVSPDNIDISMYRKTVDNEKKSVYLTNDSL